MAIRHMARVYRTRIVGTFRPEPSSTPPARVTSMKFAFALGTILLAAGPAAMAMDPKLLRLIGSDARIVTGVDLERYNDSALVGMFPSGATWLSARSGMEHVRQLITVMNGSRGRLPLLVLIGALAQRESAEDAEFGSMVR